MAEVPDYGTSRGQTNVGSVRLWEYVRDHPGVTGEDLVLVAWDQNWFTIGHCRRAYAANLNNQRRSARNSYGVRLANDHSKNSRRPALDEATPSTVDDAQALRYYIARRLTDLRNTNRLKREGDGPWHRARWYVDKEIARYGIGAMVVPLEEAKADMARRRVLILLRQYSDYLDGTKNGFPVPLRKALTTWRDLEAKEYAEDWHRRHG